ncbi:hypothetical protein HR060_14260 [Catenovulum sp. SM1970]|uniref:hypothetical protein n=1 Tax=Marinifaba aquimaris TaxID=2741323 RepID=UPI001573959B|nr:hypothetical protein [Marinifaba aquimaris]NTS78019.1 hypothetical protein [Marinifaba aquimaris]
MSNTKLTFRAIAPIFSPLSLHLGVDQFSKVFTDSLKQVELADISDDTTANQQSHNKWLGQFLYLGGQQDKVRQYQSTDINSNDIRLMAWQPEGTNNVVFHVFPNNIAVVEVDINIELPTLSEIERSQDVPVELIEDKVQAAAEPIIEKYYPAFCQDIIKLRPKLSNQFELTAAPDNVDIAWTARTLLLDDTQLADTSIQAVLTAWLAKTNRPEDATDIINGDKHYSLTWLNYAVNNAAEVGQDPYLDIMVLSQYFYVSQENCNNALRGAIETAYGQGNKQTIIKTLARTRTASRLNQIVFYEHIKYLTKPNRALLEAILNGWKFDQLVENSERMIEICNAKLQEEDNKKRERSTVMTDFLLVGLSFLAVFELSMYLTEFSREMMSRPALDYNDSSSSFFLSVIAEIDADIMFSLGFGLTLLLILVYRYIKRN